MYTEEHQAVPLLSETLAMRAPQANERPVGLELSVNSPILLADKSVRLKWVIRSWNQIPKQADVKLVIKVPDYIIPQDSALADSIDGNDELELEVTSVTGQILFDVIWDDIEPFEIVVDLYIDGEWVDNNAVFLRESNNLINHRTGGQVNAFNDIVKVDVPAAAIAQSLVFDVRNPGRNNLPPVSLTGKPVEVIAVNPITGSTVTKFFAPITIQMSYDEDEIWNWAEEDLMLFYYDQATRDWYPLETIVDTENNKLMAETDHLTIFDYKASTWQAASLPSVDSFQVSNFTGAATYGLSFWTPPGTAGLQPSLSLNYNSQVIDNSTAFTQASWVGMGWSLETGSIVRNMHESNIDESDDTYSLSFGGTSGLLLPIETNGTVTTYETANRSYNKIEFDSSTDEWTVWDRGGTKYEFDHTTRTNKANGCASTLDITWQWSLTSVTDIHGNVLTYDYENEIKDEEIDCLNEIAVYPTTITYPNGLYRISFITENRTDYQNSWAEPGFRLLYGTKRLKEILVEHDANGDSTWESSEIVRKYQFSYSPDTSNQIYPAFVWTAGGMTLTLVGVQEVSGDGGAALPSVTFTYADDMDLTAVDNGQGGSTSMEYERWSYFDDVNDDLRSLYTEFGNHECNPNGYTGTDWYEVVTTTGKVRCDPSTNKLQVGQDPNMAIAHRSIPEHVVKPGGRYQFYVKLRAQVGTTDINWGFIDTDTNDSQMSYSDLLGWTITTSYSDWESGFEMPVDYDPLATKLRLECNDCLMAKLQFILQPLAFRVTSKTITDAVTGESTTYTYQYDNPTPNTAASSQAIADAGGNYSASGLYAYPMREFRGHALTQVVNQENLANLTWFYQTDDQKGTSYRSMTMARSAWDELSSIGGEWTSAGGTHSVEWIYDVDYDPAIKSVNGSANWDVSFKRTNYTLTNGEVAIAQIRLQGANTQGEVGLETVGGQFFGIRLDPVTSGAYLVYDTGSGLTTGTTLISASNLKTDKWYAVMLFVDDDDQFIARIWQLDDPQNQGEASHSGFSSSQSWRFSEKASNGTVWLDAYIEGKMYSETETKYAVVDDEYTDLLGFPDLDVVWSYPTESITRTYEGDASWVGTKTTYEYNTSDQNGTQYGNLTRTVTYEWNGSSWDAYVGTQTEFWPNTTTTYLVSLPARSITVDCTTACNFDGTPTKLAESINIYDSNSSYAAAPTVGKLASQRVLMDTQSGDEYSVVSYGYDAFGNVTDVTSYRDYGGISGIPTSPFSTTMVYESTYDTYPVKVVNANNQAVWTTYDYDLGVPDSVTPLYNASGDPPVTGLTTATYDEFGRMETVRAPGDETGIETLKVDYYNYSSPSNPFHVLLTQNIDDTNVMQAVRYYSGTGQLLQSQSLGVEVDDDGDGITTLQNIVVDNDFDVLGKLVKQTVPYGYTSGSFSFQTQTFTQDKTISAYDILGRATSVTAPNGNIVTTSFADLQVTSTDPKLEQTITNFDVWGNVVSVAPPTGPGLSYEYDLLGRLETVTKGTGGGSTTTTIGYDFGGRKTSIDDPDMGSWTYTYDALGSLDTQTDARGCMIDFGYDSLNRLETKTYTGPGACGLTPGVTYYYDGESFTFNGIGYGGAANSLGQRTGMVDGSGITSWEYDIRGRMTDETKVIIENASPLTTKSFDTSWTYNSADMVTSMTYPDGEVVTYGYNDQGTLESMVNGEATPFTYVQNVTYDLAGRMRYLGLGENAASPIISRSYGYYAWNASQEGGLLQSLVSTDVGTGQLQNLSYDYDANSNITEITDAIDSETSTFNYDSLNRLTDMTVVDGGSATVHSEVFNYDSLTGNIASKGADQQDLISYTYDTNHPHAVSAFDNNSYQYDSNGNQIERDLSDGTYTLVYDAENRVIQVETGEVVYSIENNDYYLASYDPAPDRYVSLLPEELINYEGHQSIETNYEQSAIVSIYQLASFSPEFDHPVLSLNTPDTITPSQQEEGVEDAQILAAAAEESAAPIEDSVEAVVQPESIPDGALVVDSIEDSGDLEPGDGVCDDGEGNCTLRAAIEEANATPEADTIAFKIDGEAPYVIQPSLPLPEISSPVVINGASQDSYSGKPVVVIDGAKAGDWISGLVLKADESTIKSLAIINFSRAGIYVLSDKNVIANNYIGVGTDGSGATGNEIGILVEDASGTLIGGESKSDGNLISGNQFGVYLYGEGTADNLIKNNLIGSDAPGNQVGVRINASPDNQIGDNVISGNSIGIMIQGMNASGNSVFGNQIGASEAGHRASGNSQVGVLIVDAPGNPIGGQDAANRNRILGNEQGIRIQGAEAVDNLLLDNEVEDLFSYEDRIYAAQTEGQADLPEDTQTLPGEVHEDYEPIIPPGAENTEELKPKKPEIQDSDSSETADNIDSISSLTVSQAPNQPEIIMAAYHFPRPNGNDSVYAPLAIGATFVVNSTGDGADSNPGNGVCADSGGNCTLRAAIQEANALAGTDTINFSITGTGPHTLQPSTPLPVITEAVVIDGSTQSGYTPTTPMIVLNGSSAGAGAVGIKITAGGSTVRGLVIHSFDSYGICLETLGGNTVVGNFVGTNPTGTSGLPNFIGIIVFGIPNNTIGGSSSNDRNLFSGNTWDGVHLSGSVTGNAIQGNYIGTNIDGSLPIANYSGSGIFINHATDTTIGGTAAGEGNLISGNCWDGIHLSGSATRTVIQGNYIGTNSAGMSSISNANGSGIFIYAASDTTIGGTVSGAGNLISGNRWDGINLNGSAPGTVIQGNQIGTNSEGMLPIPNVGGSGIYISAATNTTIGGTASGAGNLLSGNGWDGVYLNGSVTGTVIQGNQIGTKIDGLSGLSNAGHGIEISAATNTTIGGTVSGAGNLLSGNTYDGIHLRGSAAGTVIQGNKIGTDVLGTTALSNNYGIGVCESTNTTIGGTTAEARNLVSGNVYDGIFVFCGASGALIQGNYIGTDINGTLALPNNSDGVDIEDSSNTTVGGTDLGAGNLISGNGSDGIEVDDSTSPPTGVVIQGNQIGTDIAGSAALPNQYGVRVGAATNTTIGGTAASARNLISGNAQDGINVESTLVSGTLIQGNYIGTDINGTLALPNIYDGVDIGASSDTTVGGTDPGAGNLISGNGSDGIEVSPSYPNETTGLVIQGNQIGTDITGSAALPNYNGVYFYESISNAAIGGTAAGARNLISGNERYGIYLYQVDVNGTLIEGNYIGTDITGSAALPNLSGVAVAYSSNTTIGGTAAGARNLISGNAYDGISMFGYAYFTLIQGNYIGTDISGTLALPNMQDGIDINEGVDGVTIGGTDPGAGNLISGNGSDGIEVIPGFWQPNDVVIQGNKIGTDLNGTAGIPNANYGIIISSILNVTIGGTAAGAGNTIAFNGYDGITVVSTSTGITMSGNSIFSNSALGIDLDFDGVTANDEDDPDIGPNGLQNYPVITSATSNGVNSSEIMGTLNSTPSTTFQLEFFASAACDAAGNGEGELYLGSKEVITDANGDASFTASLSVGIAEGYQEVTATATDPAGSTSEFSACVAAVVTPPEPAAVDALYVYDGDGNMVKSVIDGVATYYVGGHYEVQEDGVDTTVRKYYATGLQKVAVRTQVNSDPSTVNWLLGDHLGSTSLVANENGTLNSQIKYTAFGEIRSQSGTSPTDYLYTGQRQEAELGLYYYVARWYDPAIGRFIQADTIVPNPSSAMSFDRYAYTYNNPLNYTDPSGHIPELECGFSHGGCGTDTGGPWPQAGHPRGYYDVLFTPQVQLFNTVNAAMNDLEEAGHIEPGWYINQQYRDPRKAHVYSTAYGIYTGDITIDDLRNTPIDSDGNVWLPDWLDQFCVNNPTNCGEALSQYARSMAPETVSGSWVPGSANPYSAFDDPYVSWGLNYAFEGYPNGDPRRLPNTTGLPVSNHITGMAVDVSATFTHNAPWQKGIDKIFANYNLYRPFNQTSVMPEPWHIEFRP